MESISSGPCRAQMLLAEVSRERGELQGERGELRGRLARLELERAQLEVQSQRLRESNQQLDLSACRLTTQCEVCLRDGWWLAGGGERVGEWEDATLCPIKSPTCPPACSPPPAVDRAPECSGRGESAAVG